MLYTTRYDTLLAKKAASSTTGLTIGCSDDEVLAIICHEFGHWKLNHVMFRMLFVQVPLNYILVCIG